MEAELVAAALAMKEAVFCIHMTKELGFDTYVLRQRTTIHRQHLGSARRRKSDLQFAS